MMLVNKPMASRITKDAVNKTTMSISEALNR